MSLVPGRPIGLGPGCVRYAWCGFVRCFFFFQAEDGIRDLIVTGVQTCALPIFRLDARKAPWLKCTQAGTGPTNADTSSSLRCGWCTPRKRRMRAFASAAKVSAKSELLPEPDTPTTMVALPIGRETSTD